MPSSAVPSSPLHSLPTRRSSDLFAAIAAEVGAILVADIAHIAGLIVGGAHPSPVGQADVITTTTHKTLRGPRGAMIMSRAEHASADRKSTRLNSSHLGISYAVFCCPLLSPPFSPYTTLFRSLRRHRRRGRRDPGGRHRAHRRADRGRRAPLPGGAGRRDHHDHAQDPPRSSRRHDHVQGRARLRRSEEHTSELQSLRHLVCRLLLSPPLPSILSLHDALPISSPPSPPRSARSWWPTSRTSPG